jgi:hypothetical protein
MTVADRYQELWARLHDLRDVWLGLRLTVREDRPPGEATLLVERVGDEIDDGLAALDDALGAIGGALDEPDDVRAGGRALALAHGRSADVAAAYWQGVGSPERRNELRSLARRHGRDWAAWARSVDDALQRVPVALTAVDRELGHAWAELVERAASGSTLLSAHSIGQQINVPGRPARRGIGERGR